MINKESKERIEKYITEAEQQGAKILVDGRNTKVKEKKMALMLAQQLLIM